MAKMICSSCGNSFKVGAGASLAEPLCVSCRDERDKYSGGQKSVMSELKRNFGVETVVVLPPSSAMVDDGHDATKALSGGTTNERYLVADEISRGGMGVILRSIDQDIRRQVAMKVMLTHGDSARENIERFIDEAQIQGQLEHPNIVPVHELGIDSSGKVYFTMKLVHGKSLEDVLRDLAERGKEAASRHVLTELLVIFLKVCDGIAFAHSRGVIHRDIKPDNVMVGEYGEVMVMDWGLAKIHGREDIRAQDVVKTLRSDSGVMLTLDGFVAGTPSYMAPEQARGHVDKIDERSDVYSLGAVLYQMLALRPPYKGSNVTEVIGKVVEGEAPPPEKFSPDRNIPPELSAVCMKAMAYEKAGRYKNVEALSKDIRLFLEGRAVSAKEDTFGESFIKLVKRNKQLFATAAAAAVVLAMLSVVGVRRIIMERNEARIQRNKAVSARNSERAERWRALTEKNRAVRNLYVSNITLAMKYAAEGNAVRVDELLRECPPHLRHWEWGMARLRAQMERATFEGDTTEVHCVDYSPDGTRVVSGYDNGTVRIWNVESGREIMTFREHLIRVLDVAFSPDGKRVASAGRRCVKIWDAATGKDVVELGSASCMAFSPDGRVLATGRRNKIQLWDCKTGQELKVLVGHSRRVCGVAWGPDGKRLVSGGGEKTVRVWDVEQGRTVMTMEGHTKEIFAVAVSPDGRYAASGSFDSSARIWDMDTGQEVAKFSGFRKGVQSIAFSPDGTRLAGATGWIVKVWNVATKREERTLVGHWNHVWSLAYSPDGNTLATGSLDHTVKLWDVRRDPWVWSAGDTPERVAEIAFSPDGRMFACVKRNSWVDVWNAETHELLFEMKDQKRHVLALAFSPDSTRLAVEGHGHAIELWNTATWKKVSALIGQQSYSDAIAFSPDGILAASGCLDGTVMVWNIASGKTVWAKGKKESGVNGLAFSPDGTHLAAGEDSGLVKIREALTGRMILRVRGHTGKVRSVAYSPDGRYLASSGSDATVRTWEADTGEAVNVMRGHIGTVFSVGYSPDGRRLVSGSNDFTLKVWDTAIGREMLALAGHTSEVSSVAFSPDGRKIGSGSADSTVRIWYAADWDSPDAQSYLRLGNRYLTSKQYDQAVDCYNNVLAEEPDHAEALGSRGIARAAGSDLRKAIADFDRAIELDPERIGLFKHRGDARRRANDFDGALQDFARALEQNPRDTDVRKLRSRIHMDMGNVDSAIADLDAVLEMKPHDLVMLMGRVNMRRRKGDYDRALEDCETVLTMHPNDPEVLFQVAAIHMLKGEHVRALEELKNVVGLQPNNARFNNMLAWFLATCSSKELRDVARAIEYAEKAVSLERSAEHLETLGAIYAQVGRFEDAVEVVEEAILLAGQGGTAGNKVLLATLQEHLVLYKQNKRPHP